MPNYTHPITGKPIISITELLGLYGNKDSLLMWAASFGSKEKFKAERYEGADLGKYVHSCIEAHLTMMPEPGLVARDGRVPDQTMVDNAWNAYVRWYGGVYPSIRSIECEIRMFHPTRLIAGTCDLLLNNDTLIDFKTSNTYASKSKALKEQKRSYLLQLSGYYELLKQSKGVDVSEAQIVSLNKNDGTFTITSFTRPQLQAGWAALDLLLEAHLTIEKL